MGSRCPGRDPDPWSRDVANSFCRGSGVVAETAKARYHPKTRTSLSCWRLHPQRTSYRIKGQLYTNGKFLSIISVYNESVLFLYILNRDDVFLLTVC